ncbi:MAG: hypothetical protein ACE5ID_11920, partial [Acidobacteriota bacterium]
MVPPKWIRQRDRPMRMATYAVTGPSGQTGEIGVFFFAGGQGGTVDMNIERWRRQFVGPDGGPPRELARRVRQVSGMRVTTLELAGTYRGSRGPMAPAGPDRPGYEMVAAIVQGPRGPVFFKLTGPAVIVETAKTDL